MNTIAERIKFAMRAKNKKQVDIVKDILPVAEKIRLNIVFGCDCI